ncbi:MAG: serine hydrolase, partial [Pirellulales bacterium]|nr:serine hydrolase [Pirellulales bacterium]
MRFFMVSVVLFALPILAAGPLDETDLIHQVHEAVDAGRFQDAEAILQSQIETLDGPVVDPWRVELEIIRRIRLDFNLTGDELLTKLSKEIPDITEADIIRWRDQGYLQYRLIDGQIRYFESEPKNLFRFCEEARIRRKEANRAERSGWKFSLPEHIARLLEMADQSDSPMVYPVKHYVTYQLAVKNNHPRLKAGAKVRCWLPFPQEYRQQRHVRFIASEPAGPVVSPAGQPHRTVYFEQTVADPTKPPVFKITFEFETSAFCPDLDPAKARPLDRTSPLFGEYTAERPPHILFTPAIRRTVAEVTAEEPNPLLRARKLFHWMDEHIRYCSEMEYSIIRNISDKAMTTRQGDCGVQGLLFITLCRAAGIPARWQSGWESKPNNWNMHDWVEFYIEPWGWLPADPSYGLQKHPNPRVRDFYCGSMDPYRLIVNLDYARQLVPPKTSYRSEPNDFQRGEIEIDGHNLYFDEWTWNMKLRTVPQTGDFMALEEALDAVVPDTLTSGNMAGAVILVGKKTEAGYETWRKAYGYKQFLPEVEPMPVDAVFDMASMTKPIATGTSLMVLVEQGKIQVDDPVGKYLPEFNQGDKKDVTIRHLMTHMSGESPYVGEDARKQIIAENGFLCREAIRKYIRDLDLLRKPGDVVQYSCLNAILCAEVIRAVSGMEHSEFAAKHVFQP